MCLAYLDTHVAQKPRIDREMLRNHGGVSTRECACHNLTLAHTTLVDSIGYGESGQDLVFEPKPCLTVAPPHFPFLTGQAF